MPIRVHWNPNALGDVKRFTLVHVEQHGKGLVEAVDCPDHHEHPKPVRNGDELVVSGWCENCRVTGDGPPFRSPCVPRTAP